MMTKEELRKKLSEIYKEDDEIRKELDSFHPFMDISRNRKLIRRLEANQLATQHLLKQYG